MSTVTEITKKVFVNRNHGSQLGTTAVPFGVFQVFFIKKAKFYVPLRLKMGLFAL